MSTLGPICHKRKIVKNTKITGKTAEVEARAIHLDGGTHLVLHVAGETIVSRRLKSIVSCWFILQILLPFTAPLQTLDLHDLFGAKSTHRVQSSPESTTTPTISEASAATAFVALLAPTTLRIRAVSSAVVDAGHSRLALSASGLSSAPPVQRSVLRL